MTFVCVTLAFLGERLAQDHPVFGIQVTLCPTVQAFDAFALLPECMAGVAIMAFDIAFIDAPAVKESLETLFVGSFVN